MPNEDDDQQGAVTVSVDDVEDKSIPPPAASVRTPANGYKVGDDYMLDGQATTVTGFDTKGRPTLAPKSKTVSVDDVEQEPQQMSAPEQGQLDFRNGGVVQGPDFSPQGISRAVNGAHPDDQKTIDRASEGIIDKHNQIQAQQRASLVAKRPPSTHPYLDALLPEGARGLEPSASPKPAPGEEGYLAKHAPRAQAAIEDAVGANPNGGTGKVTDDILDATFNALSHAGTGATAGVINFPEGTVGRPFGEKKQFAEPIQYSTPDVQIASAQSKRELAAEVINQSLRQKEMENQLPEGSLGTITPDQLDNIGATTSRGVGEGGAEMAGAAIPWAKISQGVDAATAGIRIPGTMAAGTEGMIARGAELATPGAEAAPELMNAVSLMQRNEAIRRIAGQGVTGGIFEAIRPRDPGETLPGRVAQGVGEGLIGGGGAEISAIGARALQDHRFGKALIDLHKDLSDELLARKEITLPDGRKVSVNTREAAEQVAKEFLEKNLRPEVQTEDLRRASKAIKAGREIKEMTKPGPAAEEKTPAAANGNKPEPPAAAPAKPAEPKPKPGGPPEGARGLLAQEKVTRGDTVLVPDAEGKAVEAKVDFAADPNKGNWVRVVMPDGAKTKFDRTQIGKVPEGAENGQPKATKVDTDVTNVTSETPATVHVDEVEKPAATPEETIKASGMINKGEVSPGTGVYQIEHPDHPGKTTSMKAADITSPEAVTAKMNAHIAKNGGAPTLEQIKAREAGKQQASTETKPAESAPKPPAESTIAHVDEVEKPAEKPVELSQTFKAGDEVKNKKGHQGTVITATKGMVKVDMGERTPEIYPHDQLEAVPEAESIPRKNANAMTPLKEYPQEGLKSLWGGNALEPGEFVSNRHVMFNAEAMTGKDKVKLAAPHEGSARIQQSAAKKLWEQSVDDDKNRPVHALEAVHEENIGKTGLARHLYLLDSKNRPVTSMDAGYYRLIQKNTGFDSIETAGHEKPIVFYKGEKPVAVAVGFRTKAGVKFPPIHVPTIQARLKGGSNAVQEPSAGGVLPHSSKGAGEAGSERSGVGPSEQGNAPAEKSNAEKAPAEKSPERNGGPSTAAKEVASPVHEFGNTQINVPEGSGFHKKHAAEAAKIKDEHLAPEGREKQPHITVRYGLQDDSLDAIFKLRDAVAKIQPFDVVMGATQSFPEGKDGVPVYSAVQNSPQLAALRKAVEGAGDFKEDTHGEYKPHVTLAYVNPGAEQHYVGKPSGLITERIRVDHITVSKRDGMEVRLPLAGKVNVQPAAEEKPDTTESVKKGDTVTVRTPEGTKTGQVVDVHGNQHGKGYDVLSPDGEVKSVRADQASVKKVSVENAVEPVDNTSEHVEHKEPEGAPSQGGRQEPSNKPATKQRAKNTDWFSHPDNFNVDGPPSVRLERNLNALRIVENVNQTGRPITDEERTALSQYTGWGALPNVFAPHRSNYSEESMWKRGNAELRRLMNDEEYSRALNSTQNAHYTSPEIVRFMWSLASRLGFQGGMVLEPAMGTGNFFGMMPKGIRAKSNAIGNELDPSTYNISKLLYPSATIYNQNYVDLMLPDNSVDLAIGNPPFGVKVYDPKYPKLKAQIHDYFFVKTIDKVRPGGLLMFITSDGTMDKQNTAIRDILKDKADLIMSVRLPSSAFEKNAGTTVTTDMIVLRKRDPKQVPESEEFTHTVKPPASLIKLPEEGKNLVINEYYEKHPENVLGTLEMRMRGRYGNEPELQVTAPAASIPGHLQQALERAPRGVVQKRSTHNIASGEVILSPTTLQEGNFTVHEGQIKQRLNGALIPAGSVLDKDGKPSSTLVDRAKRLVELREHALDLINDMRQLPDPSPIIERKQKELTQLYDKYVQKHGFLNERRAKAVFEEDPHYPLLLSLEDYDRDLKQGKKSDIFSKRTIHPPSQLTTLSDVPEEAYLQTISERGFPDVDYMADLSGKPVEDIAKQLADKGLIFKEPNTGQWESKEKYLSGYVREKLLDAKKAVDQGQKQFQRNVEELAKVVPEDIPMKDIDVRLGATYIPHEAIKDFVLDTLRGGTQAKVQNVMGIWRVADVAHSAEVSGQYAGGGVPADKLLEDCLNLRQTVIRYEIRMPDGSIRTEVDQQKTIAAQAAQVKLRKAFAAYVKGSENGTTKSKWAEHIEREYNNRYNGVVTPSYDGAFLTLPGMVRTHLRDGKLMPHQANAVRRQIEEGRALLAHAVGAGKTYEAIVGAMELKRLGKIKKPLFAVPNHKVGDWAEDFQKVYPGATLLVPGDKDFSSTNRNKLMSKIATGNWDGIIIAHSQFDLMDISPERQRITMEREMEELEATIQALQAANGKRDRSVKQLEKSKDTLKAQLDALKDLKADKTILFDQTGIDHLVVDEAQRYKNLAFYTKMQRVAGLSQGNAKRALRLKMKTDYLLERYQNRGIVFLTGTPVSNTMAEQRHMNVYVAPDALEKAGIHYFDDWAANFGEVITAMELGADGRSYRPRSKFAKFVNVPEMQLLFRSFSDVKTPEDLQLPVPKMIGGGPQIITAPSTELTEPFIKNLIRRAKAIRGEPVVVEDENGKPVMTEKMKDGKVVMKNGQPVMVPKTMQLERPKPHIDNMLKVVTEGRKIATDARLIDPDLPDHPESKINHVVREVFERWKEGRQSESNPEPTTQLVFLDMYRYSYRPVTIDESTGKKKVGAPIEKLNLYHDMRKKWITLGVPENEIAIIHDYKTDDAKMKLFDAVNAGRVRILLGSTQKMGEGMNAQKRLKHLHHVDMPWKPGELEQRNGRIIRQGNMHKEVGVNNFVTQGSFDAYMAQTLQTKAEFIHQVMSGKFQGRSMIDAASDMVLSLEEMKAIASGNPDVKFKMEKEAEIARLEALEREFDASRERHLWNSRDLHTAAAKSHAVKNAMQQAMDTWVKESEGDKFQAKILGKTFAKFEDANEFMKEQAIPLAPFHFTVNGVDFRAEWSSYNRLVTNDKGELSEGSFGYYLPWSNWPRAAETMQGLLRSIWSMMRPAEMRSRITAEEQDANTSEEKARKLEDLGKNGKFAEHKELIEARKELKIINERLGIDDEDGVMDQQVATDVDTGEDVPEADGDDVAYSVPEGWDTPGENPIQPAAERTDIAFSYEPADGMFPPVITLTPRARDLVSFALGDVFPGFGGVSLSQQAALNISEVAEKLAADPVHRDTADEIKQLGLAFWRAAWSGTNSGVIAITDGQGPRVLQEEMFHAVQRHLGGGTTAKTLAPDVVDMLLRHPVGKKASKYLAGNGYGHTTPSSMVTEIAAKIAVTEYGLSTVLTPEEAADWFVNYLDQLMTQHGPEDTKLLASKLAQDSLELYNYAYESAYARNEERRNQASGLTFEQWREAAARGQGEALGRDTSTGEDIHPDTASSTQASTGGGDSQPSPEKSAVDIQASMPAGGGGGSAPKPARFVFHDEDIQQEFDLARGTEKPSSIEAFKDGLTRAFHMATRTYEHLPRGPEDEQLRFNLKALEKAQNVARDKAAYHLAKILGALDKNQYYNFTVKVVLDDLLETAKDGLDTPFFEDKDQLEAHHRAITEHVAQDPAIQQALQDRKLFWDELKGNYIQALDDIGFKVGNRLTRDNYYRHQVLMYANQKSASAGAGKKLKTPTGRGHLKQRRGSNLPINTDYLQAEHEVMAHFLTDIEVAKTVKFVGREYDIMKELKKTAMAENNASVMDYFKELAQDDPLGPTPEQMYRKLNQKQAIAIGRMGQLAAEGALPNGTGANDFSDLLEGLADNYLDDQAMRAELEEDYKTVIGSTPKLDGKLMGRLMQYAQWLMKREGGGAAKAAAGTLFKGIAEKKAYLKRTLGKEFVTWKNLVPDGYSVWQPREGSTLYFTKTVPEHVVQGLAEDAGKQVGITRDDLRSVRAQGNRFREYVIPEHVATTLNDLRPDIKKTVLGQIAAPVTKAWKIWELSSPRRFFRFRMRHLSGQAEAMFAGNPGAFKELPAAAAEVYDYYHNGKISSTLQGWIDRGGAGSSLLSQEIGDINKLGLFKRLYDAQQSGKIKAFAERVWQGYWKTARLSIDAAESVMRYAAYRHYLQQMVNDPKGLPSNWGASRPDEVRALRNIEDRAWKMANDLLGAYDDISALGQELRKYALPFWSFQEINIKRAIRFVTNAGYEPGSGGNGAAGGGAGVPPGGGAGNGGTGGGWDAFRFGRRFAAGAARKSPFLIYRLGKLMMKMAALWAAMQAWNMMFFRKEWEELSDEDKAKPVLIVGRDKEGHVIKTPRLGSMGELLGWFGLDAPQAMVRDWLNGNKTMAEVATEMGQAPVNKLAQQLSPLYKTPAELATGRSFFPSIFKPGRIHDRADYLAKMLSVDNELKKVRGEPTPGYSESLIKILFDVVDEGQTSYYHIQDMKRDFLEKEGKPQFEGMTATPKSEALRNMKLALHFGDDAGYEKFLEEFIANGGTLKQVHSTLKRMDPLAGLSRKDRILFIGSLNEEDQNKLAIAEEYYLNYLSPAGHTEEDEGQENNSDTGSNP